MMNNKQTIIEWLYSNYRKRGVIQDDVMSLFLEAEQMEKQKDIRISELEDFLESIVDDVYYYHSPIYDEAVNLLNKNKNEKV